MGKKRDRIVNEINKVVNDISCKTGVDSLKILEELLSDLDLEKKDKKYPDINLNTVSIEGGIDKIKTILESCIERFIIDKEEEKKRVRESEYYKAVRRYTQGFEYLIGDIDIANGIYGHRVFENPEFGFRFKKFKKSLMDSKPEEQTEESFIKDILLGKSKIKITDLTEIAFLEDRISYIDKEKKSAIQKKEENQFTYGRLINKIKNG